jgi:hypothetical protein
VGELRAILEEAKAMEEDGIMPTLWLKGAVSLAPAAYLIQKSTRGSRTESTSQSGLAPKAAHCKHHQNGRSKSGTRRKRDKEKAAPAVKGGSFEGMPELDLWFQPLPSTATPTPTPTPQSQQYPWGGPMSNIPPPPVDRSRTGAGLRACCESR